MEQKEDSAVVPATGWTAYSSDYKAAADTAIETETDDRLNRNLFSKRLARAVHNLAGAESVVIALVGPWGCGKTSIKNMVTEELTIQDADWPIVHYEPWLWQNQADLTTAFFSDIGRALNRKDADPIRAAENKKRSQRWGAWASAIKGVGGFVKVMGTAATLVNPVAGAVLTGVGGALAASSDMAQTTGEAFGKTAEAETIDLKALRKEIVEDMRTLEKPILVIVDDIDRLSASEIPMIFQLVKANGNFPNLVYLLLYQRETVEVALGDYCKGSGRDYLEKIVQVSFDVPSSAPGRIQSMVAEEIKKALGRFDEFWESNRWNDIYDTSLYHYFQNIRDVRRFMNSFAFKVGMFDIGGALEVNPVDLALLEVLRLFEPDVYKDVPAVKDLLTQDTFPNAYSLEQYERYRQPVVDLLSGAPVRGSTSCRVLLEAVFPITALLCSPGVKTEGSIEVRPQRELTPLNYLSPLDAMCNWRACFGPHFNRYFQLSVPQSELSRKVIDELIAVVDDVDRLRVTLQTIAERGKMTEAIQFLMGNVGRLPSGKAAHLARNLFKCEPIFLQYDAPNIPEIRDPSLYWLPFNNSILSVVARTVDEALMRAAEYGSRLAVLQFGSPSSQTGDRFQSTLLWRVLRDNYVKSEEDRIRYQSRIALDEPEFEELSEIWRQRVLASTRSGNIYDEPFWMLLLRHGMSCMSSDESRAFLSSWLQSELEKGEFKRLLPFLSTFAADNWADDQKHLDTEAVKAWMPVDLFAELVLLKETDARSLDDREQSLLGLLAKVVREWQETENAKAKTEIATEIADHEGD